MRLASPIHRIKVPHNLIEPYSPTRREKRTTRHGQYEMHV